MKGNTEIAREATDSQVFPRTSGRRAAISRPMMSAGYAPGVAPGAAHGVTIVDVEPERFCFAHYRNLSFLLWYAAADGPGMRRTAKLTEHMIRVYPQGHSCIAFVRPGVGMPDEEARDLMARAFDGRSSDLRCMSVIIQGEGFWASALRSTVTELRQRHHYNRDRTQVRVDEDIAQAASWLAEAHGEATGLTLTPHELHGLAKRAHEQMTVAVQQPNPFKV